MPKQKEQDQDQEINQEIDDWMSDLNLDAVKKVSKLDIIQTLKFELNDIKIVEVLSLPKLTLFANNESYYVMLVHFNDILYQINCNSKSFRFQLAVLINKSFKGKDYQEKQIQLIGKQIIISKVKAQIDSDSFKGKSEVYQIQIHK